MRQRPWRAERAESPGAYLNAGRREVNLAQPAVLMGRDFRALDAKRSKQNPFFRFTGTEVSCARALLFPHAEAEAAVA